MKVPGNKEKVLETTMLAALNSKRYAQELLTEDYQSERYKEAYKVACSDCFSACKALFTHYLRGRK